MKIRADFVTNSSSVSFIVTMNPAMAEFSRKKNGNFCNEPRKSRIFDLLTADLKTRGSELTIPNADILHASYHFEKKKDCKYEHDLPSSPEEFTALSDEDVWAYIYGEYFVRARLAAELKGFGATQVPRDREKFAAKAAALSPCTACGKCSGKE